ncbi:hypothetical protein J19TS2_11490 [Cohnella xylanilytica]|uniref:Uncharacterized protein n=1 Tax=Cohnella xylanilytica TaxID=557555 RepID=A0A841TPM3_9BACL|nr:hypothetical protein [Cohnella xylanilytica]MBB6690257.1 hypothetical protein [Cohnella xylanilytica]GIO11594.1 hypothetical protein J19TS2_11490 [Cohnella xylanilytica]
MASGRVDLILSPVPADVVYLTANGLGDDKHDLHAIGAGARVVLRHGSLRHTVTVQFREDGESFANYLELNARLAGRLRLRDSRRYRFDYNERTKVLSVAPSPVSSARASAMSSARLNPNTVHIGYELSSVLGMPERRRMPVQLRIGQRTAKFAVFTPSNLLDRTIRFAPAALRSLKLTAGTPLALSYNQNTQTLTIAWATEKPAPAADKGTGDA